MKFSLTNRLRLSREARLAILTALLAGLGVVLWGARWHAAAIALIALAAALVAAFYFLLARPARLPKDAILRLRITDEMREDAPRSPLQQLRSRGTATMFHLRRALEAAAADAKIATVIIELSAPAVGLATAQELHDLLRVIVAANKRVVAVLAGDNITLRDYFAACGAGEIIVNPDAALLMLGASASGFFLRNALDKLGIEAQTLQWKEYKGAAEMFSRDSMSPELRESLAALIGDWKTVIAEAVAAARKLDSTRARELIAQGFVSARSALEAGLIDRVGYFEDLSAEFGENDDDHRFVGLGRYLRHLAYQHGGARNPRIALIHGLGPVVTSDGHMAGEFLVGERTADEIRRAARDEQVRAIVFRVNSPGGSAVGSDLVWRAVREARKRGKPVVVSMGDVAGSGGYYVAVGADAIVAEPATITGSIGVVYTKFALRDLLARLGIATESVKTDEISDALSLSRPMNERELAQLNQVVGELYRNFTAKVAEGRKLDADRTEVVARGRVWSGVAAKAHGLVDELGGLGRAIEIARQQAGLQQGETHDLVRYPAPSLLSAINLSLARSELSWAIAAGGAALGVPERWLPAIVRLASRGGLTLICPLMG